MRQHLRAVGDHPGYTDADLDAEIAEIDAAKSDRDRKRKEPRIKLVPFDKIKLSSERRYLVKGLVPRVGLTVVWGPPKCGKSFMVFDMVMHVALGREYRGRRVHQGPVVYCAFEGQSGIDARIEAFRLERLDAYEGAVPFYLEPATLDLVRDHKELIAVTQRQLGQTFPAVVVLDTLNRSLAGSESSDADMTAYIQAAEAIREAFECAVLIVHHCGHDASRERGHSSLRGVVAAKLAVSRDGADNIILEAEDMRDGQTGDRVVSRLETVLVGSDVDGDEITSCVVAEVDADSVPATSGRRRRTIPKGAQIALKALQKASDELGNIPPASNTIPANTKTVTEDQWRRYAYSLGISIGGDRAMQAAFRRGSQVLIADGLAGAWQGHYWAAS